MALKGGRLSTEYQTNRFRGAKFKALVLSGTVTVGGAGAERDILIYRKNRGPYNPMFTKSDASGNWVYATTAAEGELFRAICLGVEGENSIIYDNIRGVAGGDYTPPETNNINFEFTAMVIEFPDMADGEVVEMILDASIPESFTIIADKISVWGDQSAQGNDATQVTAAYRPTIPEEELNSQGVVNFSGTSQSIRWNSGAYPAIFILHKWTDQTGSYRHFLSQSSDFHGAPGTNLFGNIGDKNGYNGDGYRNGTVADCTTLERDTAWTILELEPYDTPVYALDGTGDGLASFPTRYFYGDIAEVILLDSVPSEETRQRLEGYLAHKWGLANLLPLTHPYKDEPYQNPPPVINSPVTWDPDNKATSITLSEDNLTAGTITTAWLSVRSATGKSEGKFYFELELTTSVTNNNMGGVVGAAALLTTYIGASSVGWAYNMAGGNKWNDDVQTAYGSSLVAGDILGVAVDMDSGKIWFALNNVWQDSGAPEAGTGSAFDNLSGEVFPAGSVYSLGNELTISGVENTLAYAPPTGFSEWATPEVRVINGVVTEESVPVARTVRAYDKTTGALIDETVSSAVDGSFTLSAGDAVEVFAIAFDDDAGTDYNAVILDKITP